MNDCTEHDYQLRALAMRVAALEDNVAFLEEWCEEQQDTLDRAAGPIGYDYEIESHGAPAPRTFLRVVDLRDGATPAGDGEPVDDDADGRETEYDRRLRLIRAQLNRIRTRLALSVAPPSPPDVRRGPDRTRRTPDQISARPAGRTAP